MENKETKSVFELFRIEYGHHDDENPLQYPDFEVSKFRVGLYSTLENAAQGMKDYIAEEKRLSDEHKDDRLEWLFGFLIYEYDFDKFSYWWTKSSRNYLPDGSLLDECLTSDAPDENGEIEEFFGRPTDKLRFRPGDLVEDLFGGTVTLEIVGATPCSPEEANELKKRSTNFNFSLDSSDDCYYTMPVSDDESDHSHPSPVRLFPVRLPVSDEIRKHLEARLEKYLSYR